MRWSRLQIRNQDKLKIADKNQRSNNFFPSKSIWKIQKMGYLSILAYTMVEMFVRDWARMVGLGMLPFIMQAVKVGCSYMVMNNELV